MKTASLLFFLLFTLSVWAIDGITIKTPESNLDNAISKQAIADVTILLQQACNCKVAVNKGDAAIILQLPEIDEAGLDAPTRFEEAADYPYLHYPVHDYSWTSEVVGKQTVLTLSTPSYKGISDGLYGLLQEQLGFLFYHPRETFIPELKTWPLAESFEWTATARFDKKGFHLHTQHPLELTEALLNDRLNGGLAMVKEYIDWLARNGQNYFEFNLLESVSRKHWPEHARQFVDYGHSRGIIMGIDVSLHMVQQKAFMLYRTPPASFRTKKKQIAKNLKWLFRADWDVVNMEFSTTEFSSGNEEKKNELRLYIIDLLTNKYGAKLMGREHVVKDETMVSGKHAKGDYRDEAFKKDQQRGVLIHTVMCYTIFEEHAPVYGNENLRHMLDMLLKEQQVRETWYYPESAYWITFDNSMPMMQLSYLSARLADIELMDSLGIPGHVTFSSGWEWGYWLVDWSIARWSWTHKMNGQEKQYTPAGFTLDLFRDPTIAQWFEEQVDLHDDYLKEQNLMQYMTAMTVTDEMPGPLNLQIHPRPKWSYAYLAKKAGKEVIDSVYDEGVGLLEEFYTHSKEQTDELEMHALALPQERLDILTELKDGFAITGLRAKHRYHMLNYLLTKRASKISDTEVSENSLEQAVATRMEAQDIVNRRESEYRYPLWLLARRFTGATAYRYGYLYPVSNLHFWQREEQQYQKNRFGPIFMSIWNVGRIIGLSE